MCLQTWWQITHETILVWKVKLHYLKPTSSNSLVHERSLYTLCSWGIYSCILYSCLRQQVIRLTLFSRNKLILLNEWCCHSEVLSWRLIAVEKGTTEDEMAGWHHWLYGCESEWTLGVGDGQGGLACCDSWGRKESDMTEQLNWNEYLWKEEKWKAKKKRKDISIWMQSSKE